MRLLVLLGLLMLGACGGLQLNLKQAVARKPGNVAMLFTVEQEGKPVKGVTAQTIKIFEDGVELPEAQSRKLLPPLSEAAQRYTVVLVDLGLSRAGADVLADIRAAVVSFARQLLATHELSVYGFDGRPDLVQLVEPTNDPGRVELGMLSLAGSVKDPSSNLNGAMVLGVKRLREQMDRSTRPVRVGHLVLLTGNIDRAGRVSEELLLKALEQAKIQRHVVGLGRDLPVSRLEPLSQDPVIQARLPVTEPVLDRPPDGAAPTSQPASQPAPPKKETATDQLTVGQAFTRLGARIIDFDRKLVLLSYCSPLRAGTHGVRVEVHLGELYGSVEYQFSADGFGPGCDPSSVPTL